MPSLSKQVAKKTAEKLAEKKADHLTFKSKLQGPIGHLTLLQKSLLFAEVSMISYMAPEECRIAANQLGFIDGRYFDCDGSQAYWFHNQHDSVVVYRGTEASEWNDIQADVNVLSVLAETAGKVHRGFKKEVDDLWPQVEEALLENKSTVWFAGHSLGGAMATISAGRCLLSHIKSEPSGLFTYGSPRVGDKRYVNYAKLDHYRWVNNNDIVPRVPPVWLGYRHCGKELYLNRNGQLRDITGWKRFSDRLQGFLKQLNRFRIDQLSDHSMFDYIDNIYSVMKNREPESLDNWGLK